MDAEHRYWRERVPLLYKVGLHDLNRMGYLNIPNANQMDQGFGYADTRRLPGARWRKHMDVVEAAMNHQDWAQVGASPLERIHPLFREDLWDSTLTSTDYELLKPTLQLATLFLEEESMIGWLVALLDRNNHTRIDLGTNVAGFDPVYRYFTQRPSPSKAEEDNLWDTLQHLANKVEWKRGPDDMKPAAVTIRPSNDRGDILILIRPLFLDILCKGVSISSTMAQPHPGIDEESAKLRVRVYCAITLVHEVMHAIWVSEFGRAPEPYYMDTRISELGWTWTKAVFGKGPLVPVGVDYACPYGLETCRWPGSWRAREYGWAATELTSGRKWDHHAPGWRTNYAVHMNWVHSLFTHDFWEQVERFGAVMFEPPRILGARTSMLAPASGNSPTMPAEIMNPFPSPVSNASSADDNGIVDRNVFAPSFPSKKRLRGG